MNDDSYTDELSVSSSITELRRLILMCPYYAAKTIPVHGTGKVDALYLRMLPRSEDNASTEYRQSRRVVVAYFRPYRVIVRL